MQTRHDPYYTQLEVKTNRIWFLCGNRNGHYNIEFRTSWSYCSWNYSYLCNQVPITTNVVSSNHTHGEWSSIQHYVIKFVSNLRQVGGFLRVLWFPPPSKTDRHGITELLLKVALSTTSQPLHTYIYTYKKYSSLCNFLTIYFI